MGCFGFSIGNLVFGRRCLYRRSNREIFNLFCPVFRFSIVDLVFCLSRNRNFSLEVGIRILLRVIIINNSWQCDEYTTIRQLLDSREVVGYITFQRKWKFRIFWCITEYLIILFSRSPCYKIHSNTIYNCFVSGKYTIEDFDNSPQATKQRNMVEMRNFNFSLHPFLSFHCLPK